MIWRYQNNTYTNNKYDWTLIYEFKTFGKAYEYLLKNYASRNNEVLLYHSKWDKCYTMEQFGYFGNQLKFQLKDIYTNNLCWTMAKNIDLVKQL